MAKGIKIEARHAGKMHAQLVEHELLDKKYAPLRDLSFVIFPVEKSLTPEQKSNLRKTCGFEIVDANFKPRFYKPKDMKEALQGKLSPQEFEKLMRAFDSVGDIAIVEIPDELAKKEKEIGKAIMLVNNHITTVCKKAGEHAGIFRLQPLEVIAGADTKTANYAEAGAKFRVTLDKSFFSVRLATERLRIARLIKKNEIIAGLFAGVGPFPVVFAKNSRMKLAYSVELNPDAYDEMLENIKLNKVENKIIPILGDVKKIAPEMLRGKCDRVVMPLPKGGEHFLEEAFMCLKPRGGTIHFYQVVKKDEPYKSALQKIRAVAKKFKRKIKVLRKAEVRKFSPSQVQIVVDFKVN